MKKAVSLFLLLLAGAAAPLVAQTATTPFGAPVYYASSFNLWALNGQSPNTYTFQGRSICQSSGQNSTFFVFNTNAPVFIQDIGASTNNEVVTPSAVVNTAGSCGVSVSPSHSHYSFQMKSGTAGLQEAVNAVSANGGYPTVIALDRNFFVAANGVPSTNAISIIGAIAGNPNAILQDITTLPNTYYTWSGTAYTTTHTWVNTAPTPTAGAGAGTSPTISTLGGSTPLSGVVSLLTGSATTTGTLFTLQWPANTLYYAGTCAVASSGANAYTTFTSATSLTTERTLTVTVATTAPVAATQYFFTYICK